MKLSNGTRPGALKPGSNELVMESLPGHSCETEVEF